MRWRPRLGTVLFAVNLLIFLLPLGGIAVLRLYESELIRHTESELNMQGAFVASIYRTELLKRLTPGKSQGMATPGLAAYGVAMSENHVRWNDPNERGRRSKLSGHRKDHIHPRRPKLFSPMQRPTVWLNWWETR